ncbi:MAG: Trp biosynthesis-associated membrane protein, partial [Nocardioidaceae bacterium]|nr:Trp biosynthesis-associated membrane protein [Nocardioidaceae bacterium]
SGTLHDDATAAAVARGATGSVDTSVSGWYVVALVAAVLTTAAFAVAVVRCPRWPAMGSRYDAPSARPAPTGEQDLWRAIDEGRDPTA